MKEGEPKPESKLDKKPPMIGDVFIAVQNELLQGNITSEKDDYLRILDKLTKGEIDPQRALEEIEKVKSTRQLSR